METLNVASGISSPVSVISLRFNFTATCNLTSLQVVRWLSPGTEAACCVIPVVIIFSAQMLFYNIKHHNGSICTTFTDVFKLHFSCMLANIQCFFFFSLIVSTYPRKHDTWFLTLVSFDLCSNELCQFLQERVSCVSLQQFPWENINSKSRSNMSFLSWCNPLKNLPHHCKMCVNYAVWNAISVICCWIKLHYRFTQ